METCLEQKETIICESLRRKRCEAKKLHVSGSEASMDDGDSVPFEENVTSSIAQSVTVKINALMEKKFAELQSNLDKLSNRIEDNTKRIAKTENHISEGEDRTTSLEGKVADLEPRL